MYIKICGLRDCNIAQHAMQAGANALGVVMSKPSPRHATGQQAAAIVRVAAQHCAATGDNIDTVLVVREMPATLAAYRAQELGFSVLQLHGGYTAADFAAAQAIHPRIWRAGSLASTPQLSAGEFSEERLLVDSAQAGSGAAWDLKLLRGTQLGDKWLLAGGLSPANVAAAITAARPGGVDVSSGVETSPGIKSPELISDFIAAARAVRL